MPTLWGHRSPNVCTSQSSWALSIQPKIPEKSVGTSNGTDHFGLVRPEYSGPALNVVHFDRSGHFGRPECPFPFDKIVVPNTAVLYPAHKNNNQTRGGLGRVCATRMGTRNFRNFKSEFLLNGKRRPFLLSNLFFECKHPIIDKSIIITEPAVPSARLLGSKLYPTSMQSMLNKDLTPFTQAF